AIVQHLTWDGKLFWIRPVKSASGFGGPFVNRNHFAGYGNVGSGVAGDGVEPFSEKRAAAAVRLRRDYDEHIDSRFSFARWNGQPGSESGFHGGQQHLARASSRPPLFSNSVGRTGGSVRVACSRLRAGRRLLGGCRLRNCRKNCRQGWGSCDEPSRDLV